MGIQTIPVATSLLTTHRMFLLAVLLIAVAAATAAVPPPPPTAAQLQAFAELLLSDFARRQPNGVLLLRPQRLRFHSRHFCYCMPHTLTLTKAPPCTAGRATPCPLNSTIFPRFSRLGRSASRANSRAFNPHSRPPPKQPQLNPQPLPQIPTMNPLSFTISHTSTPATSCPVTRTPVVRPHCERRERVR